MKWYLRMWWHNFMAQRYRSLARKHRNLMVKFEMYQHSHQTDWINMKRSLGAFREPDNATGALHRHSFHTWNDLSGKWICDCGKAAQEIN